MSLEKRPSDKRDTNDKDKENHSSDQRSAERRHILSNGKVATGQTEASKLQAVLYALESKATLQKTENRMAMQTTELQRIGLLPSDGRSLPDIRVHLEYEYKTDQTSIRTAIDILRRNHDSNNLSSTPLGKFCDKLRDIHNGAYSDAFNLAMHLEMRQSENVDNAMKGHLENLMYYAGNHDVPHSTQQNIHLFLIDLEL
jgi:hypothetical protein